mgnify:CR=1 FL=1
MDRRCFLKYQLHGALWLAAGGAGLFGPSLGLAQGTPDIAVAKGQPGPATRAAVGLLGGMSAFVKPGQRVVIKPNMSFAGGPEMANNTHPDVIKELAAMCWEAQAADVLVLDNPLQGPEDCLERSGIRTACLGLGKKMVYSVQDDALFSEAEIPDATSMRHNRFMKDVLKADVLIAAPVAKSHGATGVSLSLKGMMGLIKDREDMHYKYELDQAIVDLNRRLKAKLAVIDATRVLTSNGPYGPGEVDKKNMIIASTDPVAADAMTVRSCTWYGRAIKPNQVKHLRLAHEQGLGRIDVENMRVGEVSV